MAGYPQTPARVGQLLDQVGLAAFADRPARRLSGGEQQRIALARPLALDPEFIFLDEPMASLDPFATKGVEDIIANISSAGVKVVMTTHDLGQAHRSGGLHHSMPKAASATTGEDPVQALGLSTKPHRFASIETVQIVSPRGSRMLAVRSPPLGRERSVRLQGLLYEDSWVCLPSQ